MTCLFISDLLHLIKTIPIVLVAQHGLKVYILMVLHKMSKLFSNNLRFREKKASITEMKLRFWKKRFKFKLQWQVGYEPRIWIILTSCKGSFDSVNIVSILETKLQIWIVMTSWKQSFEFHSFNKLKTELRFWKRSFDSGNEGYI